MPYGFAGHIGIAKETTWGSGVAAADYIQAFSESLATTFERFTTVNITGSYYEPDDIAGTQRNQGNLVFHGHPKSMGYALNGVFGTNSITVVLSGALFKNDFTPKTSDATSLSPLPSYTLEIFRDVTTSQQFSGVVFNTLQMAVAPNQDLRITAGVIAKSVTGIAKTTPSFPNTPTFPFTFDTCSIQVDGVANVLWESFQVSVANQLEGIPALDNTFVINRIRRTGPPTVRMSGTLEFQNVSDWNDFINQTERRFVLNFTKASSFSLTIDIPRLVYTAFPTQMGGRGRIMVNVDGTARYHVGSGNALKVSLTTVNTF